MFIAKDLRSFNKQFPDDKSCLKYLEKLKWGAGYCCVRCQSIEFRKGNTSFCRRCKNCGYQESVTANTMFHKCKLGLRKAFEGLFLISVNKKGMSSWMLCDLIACNQKSAWLLHLKAQQVMVSSEQNPIQGEVHVDEFSVGGHKAGKQGRSLDGKKHAFVAVEIVRDKKGRKTIGRAYAEPIDNFKSETLKVPMDKVIDKNAEIKADGFASYIPLQKDYVNLKMILSQKGQSMVNLHNHIMNIKNWLRGTHHSVSPEHFPAYLNEFNFRFNRRAKNIRPKIFHLLIQKMRTSIPMTYQQILANAC